MPVDIYSSAPNRTYFVGVVNPRNEEIEPARIFIADSVPQDSIDRRIALGMQSVKKVEDMREAHLACFRTQTRINASTIGPDLQQGIRSGVGTNNINFRDCAALGVLPENCRIASAEGVSERIVDVVKHFRDQIGPASAAMAAEAAKGRAGSWAKVQKHKPLCIEDMHVLQIGYGQIGSAFCRKLHKIYRGAPISFIDPDVKGRRSAKKIKDSESAFEDAISNADVISLSVPGQAGTILTEEHLAAIKPTALIINTSRGNTVNAKLLLKHVQRGGFVYIDVYDDESDALFKDKTMRALLRHPHCTATPHTGGSAPETEEGNADEALRRALGFFTGGMANMDGNPELLTPKIKSHHFGNEPGTRITCTHAENCDEALQACVQTTRVQSETLIRTWNTVISEHSHVQKGFGHSTIDVIGETKDALNIWSRLQRDHDVGILRGQLLAFDHVENPFMLRKDKTARWNDS